MEVSSFTLNTNLIPALHAERIDFRSTYDILCRVASLIVMHKDADICRVEAIQDLSTSYCYKVTWVNPRDIICFPIKYKHYTVLINDIKKAINRAEREDCERIKDAIESISDTKEKIVLDHHTLLRIFNKTFIKDVIFNNPATIVFWEDGTKTVVKAENEEFDPEKGLAMAIAKKALGNSYDYYDTFKKYVGRYEKKQKKG